MVSRTTLVTRLEEGIRLGRRITLITASAGYGKTSLISGWVSSYNDPAGLKFCWLSLEESDNDPALFWTYVLAALQTCQARLGEALAQPIWAQPNPVVIKSFLIGLVNESAQLDGRLVLVLDDFHLIQNEATLDSFTFLIEHLSPQLHLVLLSRTVPPLPLSRWRARSQITEINQNDLRFTLVETEAFLSTRLLELPATRCRSSTNTSKAGRLVCSLRHWWLGCTHKMRRKVWRQEAIPFRSIT